MLIDRASAHRNPAPPKWSPPVEEFLQKLNPPAADPAPMVAFIVTETHDDKPCDCITEKRIVLKVGEEIELTHVCHDGRVDKVIAKMVAVEFAEPEHGSATKRAADHG